MRIEAKMHFIPDEMKGKMAKELASHTMNWRSLLGEHLSEEGAVILDQLWAQWESFIAGYDAGYQAVQDGVDLQMKEVSLTMQYVDDLIRSLEVNGYYHPGKRL